MAKSKRISEAEADQLVAHVLHKLNVPCPGPRSAMELLAIVEKIDALKPSLEDKRAWPALEEYREQLVSLGGIWAFQQGLIIAAMEKALS